MCSYVCVHALEHGKQAFCHWTTFLTKCFLKVGVGAEHNGAHS